MKKAPMVLCLGLLLVFASVSFAVNPDPFADKEAYIRAVEDTRIALEANQPLTADQKALVKEHGLMRRTGELDLRGGPDAFGYTFVDSDEPDGPAYDWIDITLTGTQVAAMGDDAYQGPFDLGFDFPFYGNIYSQR